jgi:hypothetical protein
VRVSGNSLDAVSVFDDIRNAEVGPVVVPFVAAHVVLPVSQHSLNFHDLGVVYVSARGGNGGNGGRGGNGGDGGHGGLSGQRLVAGVAGD